MPLRHRAGLSAHNAFCGPQKLREDLDELAVAGALLGTR